MIASTVIIMLHHCYNRYRHTKTIKHRLCVPSSCTLGTNYPEYYCGKCFKGLDLAQKRIEHNAAVGRWGFCRCEQDWEQDGGCWIMASPSDGWCRSRSRAMLGLEQL